MVLSRLAVLRRAAPSLVDRVAAQKMERLFDALDTDGDGRLTESDLLAAASRAGGSRSHVAAQEMWSAFRLASEVDSEGALSREEFVRATSSDVDRFRETVDTLGVSLVDLCGMDGDGSVTRDEFQGIFDTVFGVGQAHSATVFAHLDLDRDGLLSRPEMVTAMSRFLTGEDPGDPINHLFGPLA